MQKMGVAFTGTPEGGMINVGFIKVARDKKILVQNMKGAAKKIGEDDLPDEIELCSELPEEEFYEGEDGKC